MPTVRLWAVAASCFALFGLAGAASAAPPPLEAYGKLANVEFMRLSPSGDRYAFLRPVSGARQLVVVPVAGGKPSALNFPSDAKVRDVEWAGDDHVLVTISGTTHTVGLFTVDAFESEEVLVLPLNGKPSFVVFEGHKDVVPLVSGRYGYANVDGHWYGYFSTITLTKTMTGTTVDHGYSDLYRVDLDTGASLLVSKGSDNIDIGGWLISPDGKVVARSSYFERTGAWQVNAGQGNVIMAGHSLTEGPDLAGFGRTADTVLIRTPDLPEPAYRLATIADGVSQAVPDGDRIVEPLFDRHTGLWIGEILGGDTPRAVLFAPEQQAKLAGARKAFANYNVELVSYDGDFNRFVIHTDGGDDSGTFWLVDSSKHSVESIGQAFPDVKETDVGPVRMMDWKAADGLEMHGVLTLPPGRTAHGLPVVVLPHGGPQARDYPGFDWWAQAFAARGYAVFQPNFRGSSGYGRAFVDAGHGQWGRKMQTDISDGLAALAVQGIVDPKRACIVGASYGGYAALAGVTVQHGLYRCAVADAGVADLRQMLKYEDAKSGYDASSSTMRYWKQFMGASSASDDSLDAISPAALAGQADAPILLIHGKDDTVVPFAQSLEMQAALKRANKPVEMVVMPNEDHWLSRPETRLSMLTAAVAFVQKYNPAD
jgi:dipeptidyl aminopeptidase/acylaminoacyl peptidase